MGADYFSTCKSHTVGNTFIVLSWRCRKASMKLGCELYYFAESFLRWSCKISWERKRRYKRLSIQNISTFEIFRSFKNQVIELGVWSTRHSKCRSVFTSQKSFFFRGIRWHAALGNFSSFAFLKKAFSAFCQEITAQGFALVSARVAFCQARRMHLLSDGRTECS